MIKHLTGRSRGELEENIPKELKSLYPRCNLSNITKEYIVTGYSSRIKIVKHTKIKKYVYEIYWVDNKEKYYNMQIWEHPSEYLGGYRGTLQSKTIKRILEKIKKDK
jgi:hypothetical protein